MLEGGLNKHWATKCLKIDPQERVNHRFSTDSSWGLWTQTPTKIGATNAQEMLLEINRRAHDLVSVSGGLFLSETPSCRAPTRFSEHLPKEQGNEGLPHLCLEGSSRFFRFRMLMAYGLYYAWV